MSLSKDSKMYDKLTAISRKLRESKNPLVIKRGSNFFGTGGAYFTVYPMSGSGISYLKTIPTGCHSVRIVRYEVNG